MFSATELQLASNSEWILTKNDIIEKIYLLYGDISDDLVKLFQPLAPLLPEVLSVPPKISKGEKYKGLPWVILDYPRYFQPDPGHFALRTLFWWGNYFMVQAIFAKKFIPNIVNGLNNKQFPDQIMGYPVYAGFVEDSWDNTFPQPTLRMLEYWENSEILPEHDALKIMIKLPLEDWQRLQEATHEMAKNIAGLWK